MKTDNESIADFMGLIRREANSSYNKAQYYKPCTDKRKIGDFVAYFDGLKYHEKWDWLMPVVDQIQNLDESFSITMGYGLMSNLGMTSHYAYCHIENWNGEEVAGYSGRPSLIECVYKSVVDFIKNYEPIA